MSTVTVTVTRSMNSVSGEGVTPSGPSAPSAPSGIGEEEKDRWSYESSCQQEETLRQEQAASHPLVDSIESLERLLLEYQFNPSFHHNLVALSCSHHSFRRVRGDGSCFYRAFLFGVLEWLMKVYQPRQHHDNNSGSNSSKSDENVGEDERVQAEDVYERFRSSLDRMQDLGLYDRMVSEDFYESAFDLICWVCRKGAYQNLMEPVNTEQLQKKMCDENVGPYVITYLRCLTSLQLHTDPDAYAPFLTDVYTSIDEFCRHEVDTINHECDALQILALTREMGVAVRIIYLDRSAGELKGYVMPDGQIPRADLLYRPGHYDIIYRHLNS